METKKGKQTLSEFYQNLKYVTPPKTEFVKRVAGRCGLTDEAVRRWVMGKNKPSEEKHLEILEEETGIPRDQLFA